jgi:polyisoprenoid-binding protein YceI
VAPAAASAGAQRYVIDPMHTFVTFEVLHFGTSTVRARFDRTVGHVLLDRDARSGEARITVDSASVNSGVTDFDKHLKSKALPVSLEAIRFNCYDNPILKAEVCGGDFETTIRRSQWGMTWGIDMGIPDEVRLKIQIEAARQ